ncbi:hypothetical protein HYH03_009104 [Edaphochlamys debaryana]|uniref:Uncharacterized protein n=1 Tax=Edaphochlamys debaryana TaxID=47281 RepID=A0A835XZ70_9CHLO|nr:hypothetical protein HYH03_009104 [Edaphochlamys debaryana]|eukprot:KAG2492690.1 hypothetical protein HYH03_009104 [Edaphochlamys debaryana]
MLALSSSLRAPSGRGLAALLGRAPSLARNALAAAAPLAPRRCVARAPTVRCVATAAGDAGPGAGSGGARSAGSEGGSERPEVAPAATQAVARSLLDALVQQAALLPAPAPAGPLEALEQLARAAAQMVELKAQQQLLMSQLAAQLTAQQQQQQPFKDDSLSGAGEAGTQEFVEQLERERARAEQLEALLAARDAEIAELKTRLKDALEAGKLSPQLKSEGPSAGGGDARVPEPQKQPERGSGRAAGAEPPKADERSPQQEAAAALLTAAKGGDVAEVRALLAGGASTKHTADTLWGDTALHLAAEKGHTAVVGALLEAGADLEAARSFDQARPLQLAAERGRADVIRVLLKAGAWLDAPNKYSTQPLRLAARGGHLEAFQVLVEAGAKLDVDVPEGGWQLLHSAAAGGDPAVTQAVLQAGADVNARNEHGHTPLALAALRGNLEAVRVLLDARADADIAEDPEEDGRTPLALALEEGHSAVAALLVRRQRWD